MQESKNRTRAEEVAPIGQAHLPFSRVVELRSNIFDWHFPSQVIDLAMNHNAEIYIEQFEVGKNKLEWSHCRLALHAATPEALDDLVTGVERILAQRLAAGDSLSEGTVQPTSSVSGNAFRRIVESEADPSPATKPPFPTLTKRIVVGIYCMATALLAAGEYYSTGSTPFHATALLVTFTLCIVTYEFAEDMREKRRAGHRLRLETIDREYPEFFSAVRINTAHALYEGQR